MLLKKTPKKYDKENMTPALHKSICTGETVAGFIDNKTGKFKDIMLIKNDKDLKSFFTKYKEVKLKFYFICSGYQKTQHFASQKITSFLTTTASKTTNKICCFGNVDKNSLKSDF